MPDWTRSMQQTFKFCRVDPVTWADIDEVTTIRSGSIVRDEEHESLGYANFDITEEIDEMYIRTYLVTIQDRIKDEIPLGVHLCQTPGYSYDGRIYTRSVEAYTPLVELKEKMPPFGYTVPKWRDTLQAASNITREQLRAPVVSASGDARLPFAFVANLDDTWLTYLNDMLAMIGYKFDFDEMGRVLFAPNIDLGSLQPVWTYNDDNSSILYPSVSVSRDMYKMPNVVEIVYSNGGTNMTARATNNSANSPVSIRNRGREVVYRDTNPQIDGDVTSAKMSYYAKKKLSELSSLTYQISYTHGYCPVRLGDCVALNYESAGIQNVVAKVTRQSIRCEPGCPVEETAVYTTNLWREVE